MSDPNSQALMSALVEFSPFDSLDTVYLEKVVEQVRTINISKGKLIFRRGKPAASRYYLLEGQVDLVDAGFETTLRVAQDSNNRYALTETSPTQVSAVAKSEVVLLEVDTDFLDLTLAMSQAPKEDAAMAAIQSTPMEDVHLSQAHVQVEEEGVDWMSCLLNTPLFRQVPPAHIQQLFTCFQSLAAKAGDVIIREGEEGDYFYVVEQGQAQVSSVVGHVDVVLAPGDYFGEEALVGNTTRNATIAMKSDGRLMRLNKKDFTTLLHEPVQKYISWDTLRGLSDTAYQLIDVRLPVEFRHLHLDKSRNMPLMTLRQKLVGLDTERQYVVSDDAGRRAHLAAYLMCQAGLDVSILTNAVTHYPEPA